MRHLVVNKSILWAICLFVQQRPEYLKALLKKYDKLSEEVLRTNFFDPDIANQFIGSGGAEISQKSYRHRFTLQLYQAAEQLKVEASEGGAAGIPWSTIVGGVENLLHQRNTGMGVDTTGLPETLDLALLKKWTQESYQYVFNQIKLWFAGNQQAGLDILLLSGRSSQLPGLRQAIIEAIPPDKRPLAIDCAEVGNYSFAVADNQAAQEQNAAKNLVCEGLAVNYWNTIGSAHKKPGSPKQVVLFDQLRSQGSIIVMDKIPYGTNMIFNAL